MPSQVSATLTVADADLDIRKVKTAGCPSFTLALGAVMLAWGRAAVAVSLAQGPRPSLLTAATDISVLRSDGWTATATLVPAALSASCHGCPGPCLKCTR